jgi:uncharacterized protein (TIGR00297 family)
MKDRQEFSEVLRQLTHILVGALAMLLRWLTWQQAALMAVGALLFNLLLLPRLARRVFRPGDLANAAASGIVLYPLSVLGLVLCFPHRLDIAAGAWGILAAGDGFSTLVGANIRTAPLAWNREKTWGGLIAGFVAGAAAAVALMHWVAGDMATPPPAWFFTAAPIAAACIASLVETVPIRLNDNISVPFAAAFVIWSLTHVDSNAAAAALPILQSRLFGAIAANAAVSFLGWRMGTVTIPGALVGAAIGIATWMGGGSGAWLMLVFAFAMASLATRLGHTRKSLLGIAEERGGRRGPGNAIANTGLAAWAAAISIGLSDATPALIVFVAALATAASDTVASEIGKAWGKTTWLLSKFRPVAPGTSGAVSLEGTAAGTVAAVALAAAGAALGLIPQIAILPIAVAATIASIAEGWLAIQFESSGTLNNDTLNFLNSAIGAGLALVWWTLR